MLYYLCKSCKHYQSVLLFKRIRNQCVCVCVCKIYSICYREECASAHPEACLWPTSAAAWLRVSSTSSAHRPSQLLSCPINTGNASVAPLRSELSVSSKCSRGSGKGRGYREDRADSRSGQDSLLHRVVKKMLYPCSFPTSVLKLYTIPVRFCHSWNSATFSEKTQKPI